MMTRHHKPSLLYNDPADADCPERRVIYAVYNRARLDLNSRDAKMRRRARYFWRAEGLDWRDVAAGVRRWEWLRG